MLDSQMAKKQPKFWRQALAFGLCVLLGLSLTLILESRQVIASSVQPLVVKENIAEKSNLIQQGRELYQAQRYAEAVNIWQLALKAENNPLSQAMVLNYLSLAY